MTEPSIIVIGNANVDVTTYVPHTPGPGATVLGTDFSVGMGGKGANQAVAASRAGGHVAFVGRVGTDSFGEMMLENLGGEDLDLSSLNQVPGPSGVATIWVESSGENRIAVFAGASASLTGAEAVHHLAGFRQAHIVVSQLEIRQEVIAEFLSAARDKGMTTILNTAPYSRLDPRILKNTSWLIANESEMAELLIDGGVDSHPTVSPEVMDHTFADWSAQLECSLIVTLGGKGAIACHDGVVFRVEAPAVKALDTVGAGDCFVGFFAAGLDENLTWQESITRAVGAASDSVTRLGAQSSYPTRPAQR